MYEGARRISNQAQQAAGCQSGTSFFPALLSVQG
jgi:hypothetical protein